MLPSRVARSKSLPAGGSGRLERSIAVHSWRIAVLEWPSSQSRSPAAAVEAAVHHAAMVDSTPGSWADMSPVSGGYDLPSTLWAALSAASRVVAWQVALVSWPVCASWSRQCDSSMPAIAPDALSLVARSLHSWSWAGRPSGVASVRHADSQGTATLHCGPSPVSWSYSASTRVRWAAVSRWPASWNRSFMRAASEACRSPVAAPRPASKQPNFAWRLASVSAGSWSQVVHTGSVANARVSPANVGAPGSGGRGSPGAVTVEPVSRTQVFAG